MERSPITAALRIFSAGQVREMDAALIHDHGVPGYELMTRAGRAALEVLRQRWPDARRILILCGAGNNAGDGYVLARLAVGEGLGVEVRAAADPARLQGDAARAWQDFQQSGLAAEPYWHQGLHKPLHADVIVDALLGTGLDRPLNGRLAELVAQINAAGGPVLALDIPSGLHADTGTMLGSAVRATATVTFVAPKTGLYLGVAPEFTGEIEINDLGMPSAVAATFKAPLQTLTDADLRRALPRRRRTAHKGHNGRLLLVGGGPQMGGAIRLAAEAALRCGAGLVYVATHPDNRGLVMSGRPEIICHGLTEPDGLAELAAQADALVLGPGLGRSAWARAVWSRAVEIDLPLVLDADGLNLLAEQPVTGARWALTPHPGEAARLLGTTSAEVNADRLAAVEELARRYGATAVLKGANSLIRVADPSQPTWLCRAGNPGMATAGMGDVLTGIVGGLLVQTGNVEIACKAGVLLHARAGDAAARAGERGLLASDLMPHVRAWANPL